MVEFLVPSMLCELVEAVSFPVVLSPLIDRYSLFGWSDGAFRLDDQSRRFIRWTGDFPLIFAGSA